MLNKKIQFMYLHVHDIGITHTQYCIGRIHLNCLSLEFALFCFSYFFYIRISRILMCVYIYIYNVYEMNNNRGKIKRRITLLKGDKGNA